MASEGSSEIVARYAAAPSLDELPEIVDVEATTPLNPPEKIQLKFVGLSYVDAYNEAETFVKVVDEFTVKHTGQGMADADHLLDFGSGWGRITRFLLGKTAPTRIHALDVDPQMTTLVNVTLPGVNATTITPMPPTVFGSAAFDACVAFSVFSHLSGQAHEAWAGELARLIKPGGTVAITVLDDQFIDQIAGAQAAVAAGTADGFAASLATTFDDLEAVRAGFDRGEIQFAGSGGGQVRTGDYYGWAAAPSAYVERVWGRAGFRVVEWVPANFLFPQALVFMVRVDGSDAGAEERPNGRTGASRASILRRAVSRLRP